MEKPSSFKIRSLFDFTLNFSDFTQNVGIGDQNDRRWDDQSEGKQVEDVGSVTVNFQLPIHRTTEPSKCKCETIGIRNRQKY